MRRHLHRGQDHGHRGGRVGARAHRRERRVPSARAGALAAERRRQRRDLDQGAREAFGRDAAVHGQLQRRVGLVRKPRLRERMRDTPVHPREERHAMPRGPGSTEESRQRRHRHDGPPQRLQREESKPRGAHRRRRGDRPRRQDGTRHIPNTIQQDPRQPPIADQRPLRSAGAGDALQTQVPNGVARAPARGAGRVQSVWDQDTQAVRVVPAAHTGVA
mmetsp:Transcript_2089/g.9478  ORF Transcript_2089/g.9478 Transcript_2089/m.9478 type:complete len:218 (+) Transcript_2089:249-902(+)